jgi:hypothetical protein
MNFEFTEEKHEYKIDGRIVPSVTQIISETTGHGWQAAQWYLERGKAIHKCAEFIAKEKEFKADPRLDGYISALRKFFKETGAKVQQSEQLIASALYLFCGTLDLGCQIGTRNVLIDFKHSIDKIRIKLQIGGYAIAENETTGTQYNYGAGVQIKEDGSYQMTEIFDLTKPAREFLSLRTCYRIKEQCKTLTSQQKEG